MAKIAGFNSLPQDEKKKKKKNQPPSPPQKMIKKNNFGGKGQKSRNLNGLPLPTSSHKINTTMIVDDNVQSHIILISKRYEAADRTILSLLRPIHKIQKHNRETLKSQKDTIRNVTLATTYPELARREIESQHRLHTSCWACIEFDSVESAKAVMKFDNKKGMKDVKLTWWKAETRTGEEIAEEMDFDDFAKAFNNLGLDVAVKVQEVDSEMSS